MKDRARLADQYAILDGEGKPKVGDGGGIVLDPKKSRMFQDEIECLLNEWEDLGFHPIEMDLEELTKKDILLPAGGWWIIMPLLKDIAQK